MANIGFFDTETTGIEPSEHRFVEIAIIVCDLETRKEKLRWEQRIDPQRSIAAAAQAVHKISSAELIGKPLWTDVAPKLQKILSLCQVVVAHNGDGFDIPFVTSEFKRIGLKMPAVATVDTMLQGRFATPTGAVPSLQALCFACDVEYDPSEAHAALYDVEVMRDCFFRGYDWGHFTVPGALEERRVA